MLRRNREIVIFNLSAIDLFCSGMGAVMVLMVLLMPYYRKQDPIPPPEPQPPPVAVVTPPAPLVPVPPKPEPVPEPGIRIRAIDVVFVMDATMSMEDELASVNSGMKSIVQVLRRLSDEVNVGFVAYIDRAVPWTIPLASVNRDARGDANLRNLLNGIGEVSLVGNEDWPEDVHGGLVKATSMSWPAGQRRQLIVLIGDARTHPEDHQRSLHNVERWAAAGEQRSLHAVFTLSREYAQEPRFREEMKMSSDYFKAIARAGNGQFHLGQDDLLGSILDILIVR
jgi:hypothetical protein